MKNEEIFVKLLRIHQLETRLKNLKKEVAKEAPVLADKLIERLGEGVHSTMGFQFELTVKEGRPTLSWRKYLDWLGPNLTPSQRAKEKEFTGEPTNKKTIEVFKRLK